MKIINKTIKNITDCKIEGYKYGIIPESKIDDPQRVWV